MALCKPHTDSQKLISGEGMCGEGYLEHRRRSREKPSISFKTVLSQGSAKPLHRLHSRGVQQYLGVTFQMTAHAHASPGTAIHSYSF